MTETEQLEELITLLRREGRERRRKLEGGEAAERGGRRGRVEGESGAERKDRAATIKRYCIVYKV